MFAALVTSVMVIKVIYKYLECQPFRIEMRWERPDTVWFFAVSIISLHT